MGAGEIRLARRQSGYEGISPGPRSLALPRCREQSRRAGPIVRAAGIHSKRFFSARAGRSSITVASLRPGPTWRLRAKGLIGAGGWRKGAPTPSRGVERLIRDFRGGMDRLDTNFARLIEVRYG